ncbi:MAG: hypothetical protein WA005_02070 [Candidatus Binataceae bacterium]
MANLAADPSYVWTEGDVYELADTDDVEGASYAGIGRSNQQAQILLNKADYTHVKQLIDEGNIAALQVFVAQFISLLAPSGYLQIPVNDVNLGAQVAIIQWGTQLFGSPGPEGAYGPYAFPIAFPNACLAIFCTTITPETTGKNNIGDNVVQISSASLPSKSQFSVWNNCPSSSSANAASGFFWIAIGY